VGKRGSGLVPGAARSRISFACSDRRGMKIAEDGPQLGVASELTRRASLSFSVSGASAESSSPPGSAKRLWSRSTLYAVWVVNLSSAVASMSPSSGVRGMEGFSTDAAGQAAAYANSSSFCHAFKKVYGVWPQTYVRARGLRGCRPKAIMSL
jgi:hypothetical protein